MKLKIFKITAIALLLAGSFSSCSQKTEDNEEPGSLIGKWKLEKAEGGFSWIYHDYSKKNIIYEFHPNGVLTVTAESDDVSHGLYESGEYLFSIIETIVENQQVFNLEINNTRYFFNIYPNRMRIDYAELVDMYYFIFSRQETKK